ncbi:MAG: pheromone autoinducer 2 transporter [Marmoricola sp.]|nr:pheromone autoinducer 2 transporter [Marmoricola sp.]
MGDTRDGTAARTRGVDEQLPSRERVIGQGVAWTARWSLRLVAIALGAVLLGLLVKYGWFVIFPVLLALILCTVLGPVSDRLRTRARFPAGLAAAVTLLGALLVVVGVGFAIAPSVSGQSSDLVTSANQGLQKVQDWVQSSSFVSKSQIDAALQGLQEKLSGSAGSIASGVLTGVSAVTNGVVTLVITLILSFLFLKDGRHFLPWLHRRAGTRAGAHLEEIGVRAWSTLGGFIRTQALVSLIDAVLIGTGLLVVGVPLAIPLAILTFFAGFIPIVGAFVAGSIAVLVALVSVGTGGALIILAVIVAVQQLEGNVLSPWLQSRSMNLHAAVVLLSVTLGSTLFGITGAFLAVPTAAVTAVVLRYLDDVVAARTTVAVDDPNVERRHDLPSGDDDGDRHGDAAGGPAGPGARGPLAG